MLSGRIYKLLAGTYYVDTAEGGIAAKAKGSFRSDGIEPRVGDSVVLQEERGSYRICEVMPRRNQLIRPPVANIDILVIVLAVRKPEPDLLLAEKLIFSARQNGIAPIAVINKSELDEEAAQRLKAQFEQPDIRCITVSCREGRGMPQLKSMLTGYTSCFAGQSAVGKSSIASYFLPELRLQTGGLSRKTDRGRHTTRCCELFRFAPDSYIADTPGFSLFEDEIIDPAVFVLSFDPGYAAFASECRFRGCSHTSEPDCGVKAAVESGKLSKERYERYCKLYNQIKINWRNRYD